MHLSWQLSECKPLVIPSFFKIKNVVHIHLPVYSWLSRKYLVILIFPFAHRQICASKVSVHLSACWLDLQDAVLMQAVHVVTWSALLPHFLPSPGLLPVEASLSNIHQLITLRQHEFKAACIAQELHFPPCSDIILLMPSVRKGARQQVEQLQEWTIDTKNRLYRNHLWIVGLMPL